jgi:hypothetical protein
LNLGGNPVKLLSFFKEHTENYQQSSEKKNSSSISFLHVHGGKNHQDRLFCDEQPTVVDYNIYVLPKRSEMKNENQAN